MTAAAQIDRGFLRLFKESITPVGVLTTADVRWFAEGEEEVRLLMSDA